MSTTIELLIPFAEGAHDRWSIARVVIASDAERPLLDRLAPWGPAHYPAGAGRAIVTLADQRAGFLDVLECDGSIDVLAHDDYDASWRLPTEAVPLVDGLDVVAWTSGVTPSAKKVLLHCGLAFGDCRHPTTRLCASAIADRARQQPLGSLLDVGSGSGILAIAGHQLGASRIVATDIDPYSRFVTKENARRNGVKLDVTHPIPEGERFDVVIANVWASAFPELAPLLIAALAEGGDLIVSGFPATQAEDVRALFGDLRCTQKTLDEWAVLVLRH